MSEGQISWLCDPVALHSCNTVMRMSENENYDISYGFYVNFRTLFLYR